MRASRAHFACDGIGARDGADVRSDNFSRIVDAPCLSRRRPRVVDCRRNERQRGDGRRRRDAGENHHRCRHRDDWSGRESSSSHRSLLLFTRLNGRRRTRVSAENGLSAVVGRSRAFDLARSEWQDRAANPSWPMKRRTAQDKSRACCTGGRTGIARRSID